MAAKEAAKMRKYRALITIEFDAPDRATAVARAKEQFGDSPHAKVRVQEATVAWMTIPDAATPTS